eukprot:552865_1
MATIQQETDLVTLPNINTIPTTHGAIMTNPFDVYKSQEADDAPLSPGRSREVVPTNTDIHEPYSYNANHSRGAMFLNEYDDARSGGGLDYNYKKVDAELPRHVLLFRKALYIAQMCMLGGAVITAAGAYIAENNGWKFSPNNLIFGHMETELIYTPYACGILSMITAIIGFVGVKYRERETCANTMSTVYLIMCCITLILAIASTAQAFADRGNVFHYARRQWNALTVVEERIFEWEHFCCNFDALEPCCRFGYGVTDCVNEFMCFERVEGHLIENFNIIIITSTLHLINMFIITIGAGAVFGMVQHKARKKAEKAQKEKKERKEGQTSVADHVVR